jgi:carbon-monoxide dehydrogenase medium subunit
VKPARFGYHRATSVAEAIDSLAAYEGNARLLAGGQSLVPMLNMRLLCPDALIDINDIPEIQVIADLGDTIHIGAGVRYRELEASPVIAQRAPLVARVLRHIGDRQIRNRGTIGGSLAHGDPTAEMALACLVLGAHVTVAGPSGSRTVSLADLYVDSYSTSLEPLEMLTAVEIPASSAVPGFLELCRRHNDFAVVSVACVGRRNGVGHWTDVRVGLGGVAGTPVLASAVSTALSGTGLSDRDIAAAAELVGNDIDPSTDIRATAEYRRHLAPIYVRRAVTAMREAAAATPWTAVKPARKESG